ncbi:MAG: glutathione S-transferase family protein [Salinarimonadaceae bacterium]|nr:MAG: glutathione S-transferase family protein [Salinarimonadaceae bacterium]
MASRFTLNGFWRSSPTYKVGLMLALAGEPFDYVSVNLSEGEHKKPDFLARQRYGQVPLLEDSNNGRRLCQAAAILDYLADVTGKFGGATLDERLSAREWMYWDYDKLAHGIYRSRAAKLGFRTFPEPVAAAYVAEGEAGLAVLEAHLKSRDWLVGEGPSIADIDIYGVVAYAEAGGFALENYPALGAWMKRFEALPGFGRPEDILPKQSRIAA